jgi:hypothetical protein
MQHSQQGISSPGEKAPQPFLFFFFSFSQQAEDRASIRIKLCNILACSSWTPPYAMPH